MPVDFCHPIAPHKTLKLWYVCNLMLDRPLDAIMRRHGTDAARRKAAVEQAMK